MADDAELSSSYRRFAELATSAVSSGWLHPLDASGRILRVTVRRGTRDVTASKSRSSLQTIVLDTGTGRCVSTPPSPMDVLSYSLSPTGRFACAIKKETPPSNGGGADSKPTVVLEIWSVDSGVLLRVITPDAQLHGDPLADAWFGDVSWSADEAFVAYLAEATPPTASSFFEPAPVSKGAASARPSLPKGSQFDYEASGRVESWGEKYDAVRLPRLFVADINGGRVVEVRGIPPHVAVGQPEWAPAEPLSSSESDAAAGAPRRFVLTYTGWTVSPRRLGIIYCYQRRCGLYAVDLTRELFTPTAAAAPTAPVGDAAAAAQGPASPPPPQHVLLTPGDEIARFGRFSPSRTPDAEGGSTAAAPVVLVYLSSSGPAAHVHNGAVALKALDWEVWGGGAALATVAAAAAEGVPAIAAKEPLDAHEKREWSQMMKEPLNAHEEESAESASTANTSSATIPTAVTTAAIASGLPSLILVPSIDTPSAARGVVSSAPLPSPVPPYSSASSSSASSGSSPLGPALLSHFPSLYMHGFTSGGAAGCGGGFSADGSTLYVMSLLGHRHTVLKVDVGAALVEARERSAGGALSDGSNKPQSRSSSKRGGGASPAGTAGAAVVTCVSEEASGLALLPTWGMSSTSSTGSSGAASVQASSSDAAATALIAACGPGVIWGGAQWGAGGGAHCVGSSSLLALCPLPAAHCGPRAVALLVVASSPAHPDRLGVLLSAQESTSWITGVETKPTGVFALPSWAAGVVEAAAAAAAAAVASAAPGGKTKTGSTVSTTTGALVQSQPPWERLSDISISIKGLSGRISPSSSSSAVGSPVLSLAASTRALGTAIAGLTWRPIRVRPTVGDASQLFTALLLHSPSSSGRTKEYSSNSSSSSVPLVVVPHGGPHSAFTSEWLHSYAWLASAGWAVLLVNYRGTTGCGEAMTASLPGNIGTNDVEDVYAATLTALKLGGASNSNASASGAASVPPALAAAIEGVDTLHQQPLNLGTVTIMSDTLDGADAVAAAAPAAAAVAGGGGPSSSPTGSARQRQARTSGTRAACFDARNVVIIGGSHGGFLAGHAIGAHAELYRAAALRNPVINVASMVSTTDIPDWCWVEALGIGAYAPFGPVVPLSSSSSPAGAGANADGVPLGTGAAAATNAGFSTPKKAGSTTAVAAAAAAAATPSLRGCPVPTPEALSRMYAVSPIAHVAAGRVSAPTLILAGMKDKRVPASQAIEFYHALKGQGLSTRLLCYPEDSHPIDKPASEADAWMNIAMFLRANMQ